jgi:hypothetical protein
VEATPEPSKQKPSTEEKIITPQLRASKRHHSPVKASDFQESYHVKPSTGRKLKQAKVV